MLKIYFIPPLEEYPWPSGSIAWQVRHVYPQPKPGGGGISNWVEYNQLQIMRIMELNRWDKKKINYMFSDEEGALFRVIEEEPKRFRWEMRRIIRARFPLVLFCNNYVAVIEEINGYGKVFGWLGSDKYPFSDTYMPFLHRVWCIRKARGKVYMVDTPAGDIYVPVPYPETYERRSTDEMWIALDGLIPVSPTALFYRW